MTRWIAGAVISGGLLFLTGCGSEPPPPRSFKGEISNAESAMMAGDARANANSHEEALANYRQAVEIIRKAKLDAEGSELARLKTLEDDLRGKIRNSEVRKVTMVAAAPIAKPTNGASGEDIAAKQQREEAEARKKTEVANAKEKKKTEDLLKATEAPKVKGGKEEESDPAAAGGDAKGGAKKDGDAAAGDGVPADAKVVVSKAQGPFPAVTDKSPDIEIPKIEIKGNSIIAYVQVYNKSNDGLRIDVQPAVFFKDANSNVLVQPQAVACFNFAGFKADAKDAMDQSVPVITTGSHSIDGNGSLQFVAVGQCPGAAKCQSVSVKVLLGGKAFLGNGPTRPVAGGEAKGAGNLGGVNFK